MNRTTVAALLLLCALTASAQTAGVITFTAEATTGNGSVTPVLTWSTAPAATSCTASGAWTGTKAAAGTATLPAVTTNATYTLTCQWADSTALVTWTNPTKNTDGSDYTTAKLTRITYGRTATAMTQVQDVPHPGTTYTFTGLASGAWFFAAKAVNQSDLESAPSATVSKVMGAGTSNRSVAITVNAIPLPPAGFTVQ